MRGKRAGLLGLTGVCASAFCAPAFATNGYQLIGIGSYQKSLGGAVTANPGTAMTAITNPAGVARVGSRADFSLEAFMPDRSADFGATGGGKADSNAELYGIPAIGWTAPVSDESPDVYFGGGMYGTSGLGVDYPRTPMMPSGIPNGLPSGGTGMYFEGYSSIAFWQMAPTLAWQQSDQLTLGASLNLDLQQVAFMQRVSDDAGTPLANFDLSRSATAFGLGVSLGMLYDVNERLTLGAAYKSKQSFGDLQYNVGVGDLAGGSGFDCTGGACPAGSYKLGLDYPQQLAVGLAYRATDRVEVSADLKWINWSSTMDRLQIKGPSGAVVTLAPGWNDQTVVAVGVGFAATDRLNLRAGFNYAKSPIDSRDVAQNLILPGVVETHYAVGFDYALNSHWEVGGHMMHVPEKSLRAPANSGSPSDPNNSQKISLSETSVGVNLGYRF